jgi:HPt (histidine-containing phosphotransfer) domain-containing protein
MNDDRVAALWERFRGNARLRVATLEAWQKGKVDHDAALEEAHKLAGALGTFGRPDGSVAAAELEAMVAAHLANRAPDPREDPVTTQLLTRLRSAVA